MLNEISAMLLGIWPLPAVLELVLEFVAHITFVLK